jgi:hypothetical protein
VALMRRERARRISSGWLAWHPIYGKGSLVARTESMDEAAARLRA